MDVVILAETKIKESCEVVDLSFYIQYAIGQNMTDIERDFFAQKYNMREVYGFTNPIITMRRRVDNKSGLISFWDWDYFDIFKNRELALFGFGDSDYWQNCISVNPLHSAAVIKNNRQNELMAELKNLEDMIIPHKFQSVSNLKKQYNDVYWQELKDKRLKSKAEKGIAPQDIIDEIQSRIGANYKKELAQIESRIQEIELELNK